MSMSALVRACNRGTLLDDVQEDIDSESNASSSDRSPQSEANNAVQSFKSIKKTSCSGEVKATADTKLKVLQ